jgi:hypothetical protein
VVAGGIDAGVNIATFGLKGVVVGSIKTGIKKAFSFGFKEGLRSADGFTTLYRAVGRDELLDIADAGGFRLGPNSMGNEWFAESPQDAAAWGKNSTIGIAANFSRSKLEFRTALEIK